MNIAKATKCETMQKVFEFKNSNGKTMSFFDLVNK